MQRLIWSNYYKANCPDSQYIKTINDKGTKLAVGRIELL